MSTQEYACFYDSNRFAQELFVFDNTVHKKGL